MWRWRRWKPRFTSKASRAARSISIADFYLLPGDTPQRETVLEPGDLITHVTLPPPAAGSKSLYLKLRDRASYEFALASAAVVVSLKDDKIDRARVALGGVGTKPWRSPEAEAALVDQPANGVEHLRKRPRRRCVTPSRKARTVSRSNWPSAARSHALQDGNDEAER